MSGNNLPNVAPGYIAGNILIMHYEENGRHYYKVRGSLDPVDVSLEKIDRRERDRENMRQWEVIWTGTTNYDMYKAEERIKAALQGMGLRRDENRRDWLMMVDATMDVDSVKDFANKALQAYHESMK